MEDSQRCNGTWEWVRSLTVELGGAGDAVVDGFGEISVSYIGICQILKLLHVFSRGRHVNILAWDHRPQ